MFTIELEQDYPPRWAVKLAYTGLYLGQIMRLDKVMFKPNEKLLYTMNSEELRALANEMDLLERR